LKKTTKKQVEKGNINNVVPNWDSSVWEALTHLGQFRRPTNNVYHFVFYDDEQLLVALKYRLVQYSW